MATIKELSIEQKARRYDELKVKAQELEEDGCFDKLTLFDLFPELEESEDERIRKELICFLDAEIPQCEARDKYIAWLEKKDEQKPAERHREDEQNLNACLGFIPDAYLCKWLKDIIHVKYDKPAEWSEYDNEMFLHCCAAIRVADYSSIDGRNIMEKWFRNLKDRYAWKPSDEQILVLEFVMKDIEKDSLRYAVLNSVLEQLKKLKE